MSTSSSESGESSTMTEYLSANPRMVGVLFTLLVLLAQAGNAAGAVQANPGP